MFSFGNLETPSPSLTTLVLGAFCLAAAILVFGTLASDLAWRRRERKREAERGPVPTGGYGERITSQRSTPAARPHVDSHAMNR